MRVERDKPDFVPIKLVMKNETEVRLIMRLISKARITDFTAEENLMLEQILADFENEGICD